MAHYTVEDIKGSDEVKKAFALSAQAFFEAAGKDFKNEAYTYKKIAEMPFLTQVLNNDHFILPILDQVNAFEEAKAKAATVANTWDPSGEAPSFDGEETKENEADPAAAISAKAELRKALFHAGLLPEKDPEPVDEDIRTEEEKAPGEPVPDEMPDEFYEPT